MNNVEDIVNNLKEAEKNKDILKGKIDTIESTLVTLKDAVCESTYECVKSDFKKNQQELIEADNIIRENTQSLRDNKFNIGKEIKDDMDLIIEELNEYHKNKSIHNISSVIKEIKGIIEDVEKNVSLMELINKYTSGLEQEEYILKKDLELSRYTLNNKQGYSLKSFVSDYKKEIKEVCEFFNEDIDKTIEYFQRQHGLCPGSKIEKNTFKNICPDIFINNRVANFNVYWDNFLIKGSSKKDIFLQVLQKIGIDKVNERLSHLYSNSFSISRNIPKKDYGAVHKFLCNNELYYVTTHGNTLQYKELLEHFKKTFSLDKLVLDIKY